MARIETMLCDDAEYRSSGVGTHRGKAQIIAMMRAFFAANPDVRWQTSSFHAAGPGTVAFDFTIIMGETRADGRERISFDGDGRIRFIEVVR